MGDISREELLSHLAQRDLTIGERLEVVRERAEALKEAIRELQAEVREQHRTVDQRLRLLEQVDGGTPRSRRSDTPDIRRILAGVGLVAAAAWGAVEVLFKLGDVLRSLGLR